MPVSLFGPPVPGAPWSGFKAPSYAPAGAAPTPAPVPGTGDNRPLFERVDEIKTQSGQDRLRRLTEKLADCLNSLVGKGQVVKNGVADWDINPAGGSNNGVTGDFSSGSFP